MRDHPTTAKLAEHVDRLRDKPQHARENIALLVSGGFSLLVFFGWLGVHTSSNTFALKPIGGDSSVAKGANIEDAKETFSSLLGAARASAPTLDTSKPSITIIDEESVETQTTENTPEATVIHF